MAENIKGGGIVMESPYYPWCTELSRQTYLQCLLLPSIDQKNASNVTERGPLYGSRNLLDENICPWQSNQ